MKTLDEATYQKIKHYYSMLLGEKYILPLILFDGSNEMKENSKTASLILSISSMVVKICIYTSGLGVVWFLQFLFKR